MANNQNFSGIVFAPLKHQKQSPFNKALISNNQSLKNQTSTSAEPLPWADTTAHNFYVDYAVNDPPTELLVIPAGARIQKFHIFGEVTDDNNVNVNFGYSDTPGVIATDGPIWTLALGLGNVGFSTTQYQVFGPLDEDRYPVIWFTGGNITAVNTPINVTVSYTT